MEALTEFLTNGMVLGFLISWIIQEHYYVKYYTNQYFENYKEVKDNTFKTAINIITASIVDMFTCHKCLAFWLTLVITWSLPQALFVSFTAFVFQKLISRI